MMNTNQLSNLLLHYGKMTTDLSFKENTHHVRVRTFEYAQKHFYHLMVNGEVVECFELGGKLYADC